MCESRPLQLQGTLHGIRLIGRPEKADHDQHRDDGRKHKTDIQIVGMYFLFHNAFPFLFSAVFFLSDLDPLVQLPVKQIYQHIGH